MKKLFFTLIAVVFALAIVTCDFFAPPVPVTPDDDDGLGPLQPGEFFIGLNKASVRALTPALARAGADFFEVVFTNGSLYERGTFREGRTIRMRVPIYDQEYDNSGTYQAYVFAGRNEGKTLLGIGMIELVEGPTNTINTDNVIYSDTERVTFRLEALITDVNSTVSSTFTINDTRVSVTNAPIGVSTVPVFLLPRNIGGLPATFDFNLTDNHGFGELLFDSIVSAGTPVITTRETILDDYELRLAAVTTSTALATSGGTTNADAFYRLSFNITTPDRDGLGLMYLAAPVYLLDAADAITWYLRGGINNSLIDFGADHNDGDGSLGGAILLGVGNVFDGSGFEIIANP